MARSEIGAMAYGLYDAIFGPERDRLKRGIDVIERGPWKFRLPKL